MKPAARPSRRRATVASVLAGSVIGVVAAAFVVRTLARDWDEISEVIADARPGWLGLAVALAALGSLTMAALWQRALRLLDADLARTQVVARYFVGEIGKYLPGSVWSVLGRGELARRAGVRRGAAYTSVALSLVALYLAAAIVVAAGLPFLVGSGSAGAWWVVPLVAAGLICLHPAVLGCLVGLAERLLRRDLNLVVPAWRDSAVLVLSYTTAWLGVGTATWAMARALDSGASWPHVTVAAVLSWLIGFLLVPVPGGVGVREAAFVAAASSLAPGVAAAVAVGSRAMFVALDALGAGAGALVLRAGDRGAADTSSDPA